MKYKIIGRQNIINPSTWNRHDDKGLKALNGYLEKIIDDENMDIDKIIEEIIKENPTFSNAEFEVIKL